VLTCAGDTKGIIHSFAALLITVLFCVNVIFLVVIFTYLKVLNLVSEVQFCHSVSKHVINFNFPVLFLNSLFSCANLSVLLF
jgi:hypothetical protein